MSEAIFLALIGAVVAIATTWIKASTDKKLAEISVLAKKAHSLAIDTHTLVNSNYGEALRISAVTQRQLSTITKNPRDRKSAEAAEKLFLDHMDQQAIVDSKKKLS